MGPSRLNSISTPLRLALCFALLILRAVTQTSHTETPTPVDRERIARSLDALRKGNLAETEIDLLVQQNSVQAIPDLKKQFWITEDEKDKDRIAGALLRFGDKDPVWWNYLSEKAAQAVNSDAPSEQQFDANGKIIAEPSPKYLAWAKVHSLTREAAEQKDYLDIAAVIWLGESRDRRAIPLLRQGLLSQDYLIQAFSAMGLAELQDKESIPLIIDACERAPADAAAAIARALLDFDTPEAKSAAKRFWTPQASKSPK